MNARLALLVVPILALVSCGYHAGALVPEGARTVAVPVFDNDTFRREIEVEITKAVTAEIHARTALRLIANAGRADLVVRGRIRGFSERVLSDRAPDEVLESAVVVTLEVAYENRVAGTRWTRRFEIREPYSTFKGQTLATARAEAFENLAEKVIQALEGDWPDRPTESS